MKMILNEYRLMPWQKEAQQLVTKHMEDFFFGEGAALPPGYVPQQAGEGLTRNFAVSQTLQRAPSRTSIASIDGERQPPVRLAHGRFRLRRPRRPREDESQVAARLGQRLEQLIRFRGDADVLDVRHRAGRSSPADARKTPRRGIGIIITAAADRHAPAADRLRRARAAAARARASDVDLVDVKRSTREHRPADRPRRHFEHVHRRPAAGLTRHSAWIGPCAGRARRAARDRTSTIAPVASSARDGVT